MMDQAFSLGRGCWLDPMGPESVWRGRDPEMAAPGMISFLTFLSRPQTSGGPRWGRVAWRKASGYWPCPSPPGCQPHSEE